MTTYLFDGTLGGLLTAIFESFERRQREVTIICSQYFSGDMFSEVLHIKTDEAKAARVWKGLGVRTGKDGAKRFYSAFLSELSHIYQHLFYYAQYIFTNTTGHDTNFGNEYVLSIAQMAQQVHREKHRMEAFIRFKNSNDGLYFAEVDPDYNVLPLIIPHFRNRYADQPWLIYDKRRKYGIHYDLYSIHEVVIDINATWKNDNTIAEIALNEEELLYTTLWKDYFKNTNIKERRNMKLHIRHVPRRYWKYLTEKADDLKM